MTSERNASSLVAGALALAGVILAVVAILAIWGEVSSALEDAWDGTFQCRPGETYTTEECP